MPPFWPVMFSGFLPETLKTARTNGVFLRLYGVLAIFYRKMAQKVPKMALFAEMRTFRVPDLFPDFPDFR